MQQADLSLINSVLPPPPKMATYKADISKLAEGFGKGLELYNMVQTQQRQKYLFEAQKKEMETKAEKDKIMEASKKIFQDNYAEFLDKKNGTFRLEDFDQKYGSFIDTDTKFDMYPKIRKTNNDLMDYKVKEIDNQGKLLEIAEKEFTTNREKINYAIDFMNANTDNNIGWENAVKYGMELKIIQDPNTLKITEPKQRQDVVDKLKSTLHTKFLEGESEIDKMKQNLLMLKEQNDSYKLKIDENEKQNKFGLDSAKFKLDEKKFEFDKEKTWAELDLKAKELESKANINKKDSKENLLLPDNYKWKDGVIPKPEYHNKAITIIPKAEKLKMLVDEFNNIYDDTNMPLLFENAGKLENLSTNIKALAKDVVYNLGNPQEGELKLLDKVLPDPTTITNSLKNKAYYDYIKNSMTTFENMLNKQLTDEIEMLGIETKDPNYLKTNLFKDEKNKKQSNKTIKREVKKEEIQKNNIQKEESPQSKSIKLMGDVNSFYESDDKNKIDSIKRVQKPKQRPMTDSELIMDIDDFYKNVVPLYENEAIEYDSIGDY